VGGLRSSIISGVSTAWRRVMTPLPGSWAQEFFGGFDEILAGLFIFKVGMEAILSFS
jgi:hypothetical protein